MKKSIKEIINENLEGLWCDGLAIISVSDNQMDIDNIYCKNGTGLLINRYPFSLTDKIFTKVEIFTFGKALEEFITNKKTIISPKLKSEDVYTFEGPQNINFGGNVYSHTSDNRVIVNDKHWFNNIDEILGLGFISKEEKLGKWLVF